MYSGDGDSLYLPIEKILDDGELFRSLEFTFRSIGYKFPQKSLVNRFVLNIVLSSGRRRRELVYPVSCIQVTTSQQTLSWPGERDQLGIFSSKSCWILSQLKVMLIWIILMSQKPNKDSLNLRNCFESPLLLPQENNLKEN